MTYPLKPHSIITHDTPVYFPLRPFSPLHYRCDKSIPILNLLPYQSYLCYLVEIVNPPMPFRDNLIPTGPLNNTDPETEFVFVTGTPVSTTELPSVDVADDWFNTGHEEWDTTDPDDHQFIGMLSGLEAKNEGAQVATNLLFASPLAALSYLCKQEACLIKEGALAQTNNTAEERADFMDLCTLMRQRANLFHLSKHFAKTGNPAAPFSPSTYKDGYDTCSTTEDTEMGYKIC